MNLYPFQNRGRKPSCLSGVILSAFLLLSNSVAGLGGVAYSQVTPPITSSGLNTQISAPINLPAGDVQYDITGGTRPGGTSGTNLFHSFGDFSVPTNNIANFLNAGSIDLNGNVLAPNLPTSNILGRVTGGDPSTIFGMIQTNGPNGFGTANLFLMNPAGFLFGPNATVNVGGMMTFTTADYLRFQGADTLFNKVSTPESLSLLSTVPVAAFGFIGSNPATIAIQGSTLKVAQGQTLSFVGGNTGFNYIDPDTGNTAPASVPGGVTMTGGKLLALGGQINLASVASPGEVSAVNFMPAPGMTMGQISLSQGATLDVSGNAAGTVKIRGGEFVIAESTISADTTDADGASTAVEINVIGNLSIANDLGPAITARTSGSGNAGEVRITSASLTATSNAQDFTLALIDTHTSGTRKAGNVSITTGDLQATGPLLPFWFIDSGTQGPGNGGDVNVTARNILLNQTEISTGDFRARNLPIEQDVTGSGGNIKITADSLDMTLTTITTDAFGGHGGDITLAVGDIQMKQGSQVGVSGLEGSGAFTVNAGRFVMDSGGLVEADTAFVPGKPLTITANIVELKDGSAIRSHTVGNASAGDIIVTASDHITLSDGPVTSRPSGFYSSSVGIEDVALETLGGNSGSVFLTTSRLEMSGGGRIDTSTQTSGRGGDVTINAALISSSGERTFPTPEDDFDIADSRSSGIFSRTVGSEFCSGPCGRGGDITINAGQLVQLDKGASISASSTGTGNAGNISINAGQQLDILGNSSVKTEAAQTSGGNIDIQAIDRVRLVNSSISTSVLGGGGSGGNITIDPDVVVLQNSRVIAQAVQGAGGNITITTPLFLADSSSLVSASSQVGLNGTVTIQSPTSNVSGSLGPLASKPSQAQALLTQRCAALASGQASSFVVAGREQLPADPGGWLTSPLAFAALGESLDADHAIAAAPAAVPIATHDANTVSLRRLTPAWFLMANFAESAATACHS
jgi:filamentous hemagglutinin family protein